jgi:hypothetical protein
METKELQIKAELLDDVLRSDGGRSVVPNSEGVISDGTELGGPRDAR